MMYCHLTHFTHLRPYLSIYVVIGKCNEQIVLYITMRALQTSRRMDRDRAESPFCC